MQVSQAPRLAVIGSGRYAMALISSLTDAVDVDALQVVWILPNAERKAYIFDGHGWNSAATSIEVDPLQTALKVSSVVCGRISTIAPSASGHIIYCGGRRVMCTAIAIALDPFHDMGVPTSDDFTALYGSPRPIEDLNYLRNVSDVTLNLLSTWQADELKAIVTQRAPRRYIQSSLRTGKPTLGAALPIGKPRDLDEEDANADDDDDMEYDRPHVLELKVPLISTQFAASLLSTSQSNSPELLYFAMNEGDRCLTMREAGVDDSELERICAALRAHYLLSSDMGKATLVRDVSSIDISRNSLTTLNSITETFFLLRKPEGSETDAPSPIQSMLRHLDVSHNPLGQGSVTLFLSALLTAGSVSHLASLNLCHCGLTDMVAEGLCSAITRMTSLVTLNISGNKFTAQMSGEILLASRHHIKSLNMNGLDLHGCEHQLDRLFSSRQLERVFCADCGLEDSAALCIGTRLVNGESRASLRVLDLSGNSRISSDGLRFLLECVCAGLSSESCRLQEVLLEGCSGIGVREIVAAANVVQHCRHLEAFTFSTIFEEQLCLQVFVDCAVKYGNALVNSTLVSFVFPPSRCDTSASTPTNRELPQATHEALHQRLVSNRARRAAREEQLASRALSIATASDLAAEAARSLPPVSSVGAATHYLRIDDSANAQVYAAQDNSDECDAYRYRRWVEALRSDGELDDVSTSTVAGYTCGSVDTATPQWAPFRDALVTLSAPALPHYVALLAKNRDGTAVVNDDYFISVERKLLMVGCGARTSFGDAPFPLSVNTGVHDAMYSRLVLPVIRRSILAVLAPRLLVSIPRTDAVGLWMSREDVPPNVLRQKLLECLALSYSSMETYVNTKRLKLVLNELTHRLGEQEPPAHDPLHQQCKRSEALLLDALSNRGAAPMAEKLPPPPPPAASAPAKKPPDAPLPQAQPVIASVVDTHAKVMTTYHVMVEALKSMISVDMQ